MSVGRAKMLCTRFGLPAEDFDISQVLAFRDCHFSKEAWKDYLVWADHAMEILRDQFDVVGLWFDVGIPPMITGSAPMDRPHGSANVSWILRWDSMEQLEEV